MSSMQLLESRLVNGCPVPALELSLMAPLVLVAMALSSVVAGASVRRMHLVEIRRAEVQRALRCFSKSYGKV